MTKLRSSCTLSGLALSCCVVLASTGSAQTRTLTIQIDGKANAGTVVLSPLRSAPPHLGSGPIDMNNLPQEILDCDVCRQRLGLPPRNNMAGSNLPQQSPPQQAVAQQPETPNAGTGRMLGSPGMMSSIVAEQMAKQGYVIEEFKPPQPDQGAIQLGNIPPEARQQFMRSLDLPTGARVMSAEVKELENITASPTKSDSESITESSLLPPPTQAVESQPKLQVDSPAKEQLALEQTISQLQKKLEDEETKQAKLTAKMERLQSDSQKQMERADAANREVLTMLETRTAEVTELQLKLKSQQEAMQRMKLGSKESQRGEPSKSEAKKKSPNKSKEKKPAGKA